MKKAWLGLLLYSLFLLFDSDAKNINIKNRGPAKKERERGRLILKRSDRTKQGKSIELDGLIYKCEPGRVIPINIVVSGDLLGFVQRPLGIESNEASEPNAGFLKVLKPFFLASTKGKVRLSVDGKQWKPLLDSIQLELELPFSKENGKREEIDFSAKLGENRRRQAAYTELPAHKRVSLKD